MNLIYNNAIQDAISASCIASNLRNYLVDNVGIISLILAIILSTIVLISLKFKKEYRYINTHKVFNVKKETIKNAFVNIIYALVFTFILSLVFGYRPYIVTSGSMRPSIEPGAMVLIHNTQLNNLDVGDVVTFKEGSKYNTHQIVAIKKDGTHFQIGEVVQCDLNGVKFTVEIRTAGIDIITNGTANDVGIVELVKYSQVQGKVYYCIWYLGTIVHTIRTQFTQFILMLVVSYFAYRNYLKQPEYSL